MKRPYRKYVLDTHLFIDGFRDPAAKEALQQFHRLFAPFEYLNVVVAQELRAGARPDENSVNRESATDLSEAARLGAGQRRAFG